MPIKIGGPCSPINVNDDLAARLRSGDFVSILEEAGASRRILSRLTGLSYHPEEQVAGRAMQAFGLAAARIAARHPEYVRGHLRRLFWLLNDESGGIGWRAPEMIGETIACCPGQFDEFISPLAYLLDMEEEDAPRFRPGVLRALLRIAVQRPEAIAFARPLLTPLQTNDDPSARALAEEILALTNSVQDRKNLDPERNPLYNG